MEAVLLYNRFMKLKRVSSFEDVDIIRSFFHDIFPEEPDYDCIEFEKSITGNHSYDNLEYYIAYENGVAVGFAGIYGENKTESWLGWFGIRPQFRRRGYARNLLRRMEDIMRNKKYKISRIYTDKVINSNAYNLYLSDGYVEDSQYEYDFITMSNSIDGITIPEKWVGIPYGFESEPPPTIQ